MAGYERRLSEVERRASAAELGVDYEAYSRFWNETYGARAVGAMGDYAAAIQRLCEQLGAVLPPR